MSQLLENVVSILPVYRVLDREKNLNFFREVLGMKVLLEEGAMVWLGGHQSKEARILLEESPDSRPVIGEKKHGRTVIKANQTALLTLLESNSAQVAKVYQGPTGFAFEAFSPERDLFLLTSDEPELLVEYTRPLPMQESQLKALPDFELEQIELKVAKKDVLSFLGSVFDQPSTGNTLQLRQLKLVAQTAAGEDLEADMEETLDLELLAFKVNKDFDLSSFAANDLKKEGHYLDQASSVLSFEAPNHMEIWLMK